LARTHRVPVESVVPGLGSTVVDSGRNGWSVFLLDDFFQGQVLDGGVGNRSVEFGDVASMVLVVVELQGLSRDQRSESIQLVGKGSKGVGHR